MPTCDDKARYDVVWLAIRKVQRSHDYCDILEREKLLSFSSFSLEGWREGERWSLNFCKRNRNFFIFHVSRSFNFILSLHLSDASTPGTCSKTTTPHMCLVIDFVRANLNKFGGVGWCCICWCWVCSGKHGYYRRCLWKTTMVRQSFDWKRWQREQCSGVRKPIWISFDQI